jgi:hypothetical protein
VKERIGREMLPYLRRHDGHEKPCHENSKIVSVRGVLSHRSLRKASAAHPVITGLGGSAGIAVRGVILAT